MKLNDQNLVVLRRFSRELAIAEGTHRAKEAAKRALAKKLLLRRGRRSYGLQP